MSAIIFSYSTISIRSGESRDLRYSIVPYPLLLSVIYVKFISLMFVNSIRFSILCPTRLFKR